MGNRGTGMGNSYPVSHFSAFQYCFATLNATYGENPRLCPRQMCLYEPCNTVRRRLSGPLLSGPLLSGPLLSGPLLSGPLLSGPLLSGPLLSGPLLSGPLLRSSVIRSSVIRSSVIRSSVIRSSVIRSSVIRIPRHPEEYRWLPINSIWLAYIQYVCSIIRFPRLSGYCCGKRMQCAVMQRLTVVTLDCIFVELHEKHENRNMSRGGGGEGHFFTGGMQTRVGVQPPPPPPPPYPLWLEPCL